MTISMSQLLPAEREEEELDCDDSEHGEMLLEEDGGSMHPAAVERLGASHMQPKHPSPGISLGPSSHCSLSPFVFGISRDPFPQQLQDCNVNSQIPALEHPRITCLQPKAWFPGNTPQGVSGPGGQFVLLHVEELCAEEEAMHFQTGIIFGGVTARGV